MCVTMHMKKRADPCKTSEEKFDLIWYLEKSSFVAVPAESLKRLHNLNGLSLVPRTMIKASI